MKRKSRHMIFRFLGILLILGAVISCDKNDSSSKKVSETMVARYRASVYKKPGSVKKEDWLATLEKAERVKIINIKNYPGAKEGKERELAEVELADGETGFLEARHLAIGSGVILSDSVSLYKRPSITSGMGRGEEFIKPAIVVFIENEEYNNGDWVEISGGSWKDKTYFRGWIKKDTRTLSTEADLVAAAVRLNQLSTLLKSSSESDQKKARDGLENLIETVSAPVSTRAEEILGLGDKVEGDAELKEESPDSAEENTMTDENVSEIE